MASRFVFSALCVFASIVVATTMAGPKVDFDRATDFSKYRTYGWKGGTPASSDRIQDRIERAIDERLEAGGLTRQDGGGDLIVVTHISTSHDTMVTADGFGYQGWPGWGGGSDRGAPSVGVSEVPGGTLIIDLVDAETSKLVWRGIASVTIKESGDKADKQIDKKIGKLFRQFPPSDGGSRKRDATADSG
jgi:hypothetical protein